MNTKLRFKQIGILIGISLIGLIVFQGYWLKGLYDSLYSQMELNIQEAMLHADYKEVFLRLNEQKRRLEKDGIQTLYFNSGNDSIAIREGENVNPSSLHVTIDDLDELMELDSTLFDLFAAVGKIEGYVLRGLHSYLDTLISVRVERYDSLLTTELQRRGINTRYQLSLMEEISPNHTIFRMLSKNYPGQLSDTTSAPLDWKNAPYYDYPLYSSDLFRYNSDIVIEKGNETFDTPSAYRLYLKSPAQVVLNQMRGILFSSFLLLVVVISAFVYLLRTILRQKTIEELKTDFTNNMTHELKTPISVSYAAVDSLLNFSGELDEKQERYLTIVKEQLTHLTALVEQILTLAVENRDTFRLKPERVRVSELFDTLVEQTQVKTKGDAVFTVSVPEGMELTTDRTHLYNMLSNLIDNAIKYSDKTPCRIELRTEKDSEVRLTVIDNGSGISAAQQARIFDKFYRIPSGNLHNVKGQGLGLYYVKHIMEKQGGRVTVKSAPGKGSSFTLHFEKDNLWNA